MVARAASGHPAAAPPSVAKNFRRSMWLAILAAPGGVTSTHPTFISAGLLADPLIQIPVFRPNDKRLEVRSG
jgi:hypothetical protein